jgi:hypothetical protein
LREALREALRPLRIVERRAILYLYLRNKRDRRLFDFERILRLPPACREGSFDAGVSRVRNLFKVLVGVDTLRVFGTLALAEFEGIEFLVKVPEFIAGGALGPLNISPTCLKISILYYPLF